jgi:hypothetical protein
MVKAFLPRGTRKRLVELGGFLAQRWLVESGDEDPEGSSCTYRVCRISIWHRQLHARRFAPLREHVAFASTPRLSDAWLLELFAQLDALLLPFYPHGVPHLALDVDVSVV